MDKQQLDEIRARDAEFVPMTNEQADAWGDDAMASEEDRRALLGYVDELAEQLTEARVASVARGMELRDAQARLAEVTEERDALRVTLDMVLHIPNMTNDQLEELKARCQKIIDGATDSASAATTGETK